MRVAATVAQGVHGRRRVGTGDAFWQYRRYDYGDAAQSVDWRRSARGDDLFVRQTEWEAAQSVWLWRDASASMRWASSKSLPTKAQRADLLTLALMSLLVRGGERVALLGEPGVPASGRAALIRLAEALIRSAARAVAGVAADDASVPPPVPLPRYATVVLVGDFLAPWEELSASLRALAARGIAGHLLQLLDPAEATLPWHGRSRFLGLEAEGDLLVGRAETLRSGYIAQLAERQHQLTEIARTAGWSYAATTTDTPPQPALLALYMAMSGARGPRAA
ncbi:MAG: DUF58 domain-containing protein [Alphaproteobacteria bacterium]|nr:DUF58 domain-containing protein [Alphaproteobacteria bacterium]